MKPTATEEIAARLAALKDPKVHAREAPPGYRLKGVSTLLDAAGEVVQTWVKTAQEPDPAQATLQAFREAVELEPLPRAAPVEGPGEGTTRHDRLTVYPLGDPHFGMLSWPDETGEDFNLQIARANLMEATGRLVSMAPPTTEALIVNLGDFLHADNYESKTARSGNALDVDSRWSKVLRVSVWTLIEMVRQALTKHASVKVIHAKGNHDDTSAYMLAVCMAAHFMDEPRVEIEESPGAFHYHEFGVNLIGVTHGHTVKAAQLPLLMAADKPEAWGRTRFRYWLTGHVHHESVKEHAGATVETFNTLAAKDAWHHGQGYRARRSMKCDVYDHRWGRVLRHECGIEQLNTWADK